MHTILPRILVAGGGFNTRWIRYMASLTGVDRPRICYLPTAVGDADSAIVRFYDMCAGLPVEPFVQRCFIESFSQAESFETVLLSMHAIVVSGGNTVNQQAIWRAHGIDVVLRTAWERGIVLGGSSAGSLCWFVEGTTDSRPQALSVVEGLGFLPYSHSPHYDGEPGRRPLFQQLIASGAMRAGYACDNDAGILFEGTRVGRVFSARDGAGVYHVSSPAVGEMVERPLETEPLPGD
jgi:peptidase E